MKYGYTRISSATQDGNTSLKGQAKAIHDIYPDAIIISEIHSGATKRVKFEALLEEMQEGDMLICAKLDRFCRNIEDGLNYIKLLHNKGCKIHILNLGLVEDTAYGKMVVSNLLAYAEFERALFLERSNEGKRIARMNPDFRDGRPPKFTQYQLDDAVRLTENHSLSQVERMTGISASTIKRHKRKLKATQCQGVGE